MKEGIDIQIMLISAQLQYATNLYVELLDLGLEDTVPSQCTEGIKHGWSTRNHSITRWKEGWMDVRTYVCMYACMHVCLDMYVCM